MSHADDLALVTSCRDGVITHRPGVEELTMKVTLAALSLIEDTLKRHAPTDQWSHDANTGPHCLGCTRERTRLDFITADHPCENYEDALTALHTIATALGVSRIDGEAEALELRTPNEWVAELKLGKIVDPDGWRGAGGKAWMTPISREEFLTRYANSTIDARGQQTP